MHTSPSISRDGALSLCHTVDALRLETLSRCTDGAMSVCADDLLGRTGTAGAWLTDLRRNIAAADPGADVVTLPDRGPGELTHVAYTIAAVLVWADSLRRDGQLCTGLPAAALSAWAQVEVQAGMGGRTARVISPAAVGADETVTVHLDELDLATEPDTHTLAHVHTTADHVQALHPSRRLRRAAVALSRLTLL